MSAQEKIELAMRIKITRGTKKEERKKRGKREKEEDPPRPTTREEMDR